MPTCNYIYISVLAPRPTFQSDSGPHDVTHNIRYREIYRKREDVLNTTNAYYLKSSPPQSFEGSRDGYIDVGHRTTTTTKYINFQNI